MHRTLRPVIESWLFKGKVITLYGARQVGKTTLSREILKAYGDLKNYYLCEHPEIKALLMTQSPERILQFLGNAQLIVLDEAQVVPDIGQTLKILHDLQPSLQIIATGSSSFDLAAKISEPLTGRALQFMLYPISLLEMESQWNRIEIKAKLNSLLLYGSYPGVMTLPEAKQKLLLNNLTEQYLYRDVLQFEDLKNSHKILQLLKLLALQLGSEVSIHELGQQLGISRASVEKYLDILEKMFVIFRLGPFSRNLRSEVTRKSKYYFMDLGIRNSLLNHFSPIEARADIGALWENFCIIERIKFWHNQGEGVNHYFWRSYEQHEIDYLEERDGVLSGFECKWQSKAYSAPKSFQTAYPEAKIACITPFSLFDLVEKVPHS